MTDRYVLFLTLPSDVPAKAGPVEVKWPGDYPVDAEVLGCDFTGVRAFMDRQEAFDDLLAVVKAYRAACEEQDIRLGSINGDADAAIAKAEGSA